MLKGVLIYTEYEAARNAFFIGELISYAEKNNINLKLLIFEKTKFEFNNSNYIIYNNDKKITNIDFVILRMMNYSLAKKFEECNVKVFNSSYVSKISDNKYLTYLEMKNQNIPVLNTFLQYDILDKNVFYPNVTKPIDSKGGDRVFLNKNYDDYKKSIALYKDCGYIVQEVADITGKDLRVYVIGNQIITSILRTAKDGIVSNYCKGGIPSLYNLDKAEKGLVERVISYIKADYIGIDFLFTENGLVLNEIENVVGARMVYEKTNINIAKLLIEYINAQKCK